MTYNLDDDNDDYDRDDDDDDHDDVEDDVARLTKNLRGGFSGMK
jgi:hypothetical protein